MIEKVKDIRTKGYKATKFTVQETKESNRGVLERDLERERIPWIPRDQPSKPANYEVIQRTTG